MHGIEPLLVIHTVTLVDHEQELAMVAGVVHRCHQPAAVGQLVQPRGWQNITTGGRDDAVIWRVSSMAQAAVAEHQPHAAAALLISDSTCDPNHKSRVRRAAAIKSCTGPIAIANKCSLMAAPLAQ